MLYKCMHTLGYMCALACMYVCVSNISVDIEVKEQFSFSDTHTHTHTQSERVRDWWFFNNYGVGLVKY